MLDYEQKVDIIMRWLDKEITVPSFQEEKVRRAVKFGLFEIRDKNEEIAKNEEKDG